MVGVGERRQRSDKKREVKALVPVDVKEAIFRLSHVTNTPLKDVSEFLTVFVMKERDAINELSKHFKRSVGIDSTFYNGNINAHTVDKRLRVPGELISIKFKRNDYELISALAYALDCTPTRATAILLEQASRNIKAVNEYVYINMVSELTEGQIRELRKVLSYVNRYDNDRSSWMSLLSAIVGDIRPATRRLREIVEDFLASK